MKCLGKLLLLCAFIMPAWAGMAAVEQGQDFVVEQRLADIATELRCLVCQNESIAGSRADLAVDLRRQIREQIAAGKSNQDILTYMVDRYGDFVRYRPPLKPITWLLWFGPAILLVASSLALIMYLRRRNQRIPRDPLSEQDVQHAKALLQPTGDRDLSS
jgi:cytochrome c-type biogenesis protein CcmH